MDVLHQDEELVLEASVYAWALEKPMLNEDAPGEMVGGNFGVPHRDAAYLVNHTDDGTHGTPKTNTLLLHTA